jgi:hypothetical protein
MVHGASLTLENARRPAGAELVCGTLGSSFAAAQHAAPDIRSFLRSCASNAAQGGVSASPYK